jgi:exopolysaccharide production protein ExoZ
MLNCLQAGRALAALAVVAFHLSGAFGDSRYGDYPVSQTLARHGNLGVDFFFVLSGFIILAAHAKDVGRPERWGRYIWRRFARVYPIYWIYLAAFCLLLAVGAGYFVRPDRDAAAWVSAVSLIHLSQDAPPLHVAWTLFHEIAFYGLFSLLILNRWIGLAALTIWAGACLTLHQFTGESGYSAWQVYTSAYNLEFFCGMAAYGLFRRGRNPVLLLAAGGLVLAGALVLSEGFDRVENALFAAGFALTMAGATIAESRGRLRAPKLLVALGGASYSLYLIHVPVIGALLRIAAATGVLRVAPKPLLWWVLFAITAAVAYGAWILLEKPLQQALRPGPRGAAAPVTGATARADL